jgi:hypothetical protein
VIKEPKKYLLFQQTTATFNTKTAFDLIEVTPTDKLGDVGKEPRTLTLSPNRTNQKQMSAVIFILIWISAALVVAALWHTIVSWANDNYPKP